MRAQRSLDAGVAGHGLAADTPRIGVLELVVNVKEPAALALLSLASLGRLSRLFRPSEWLNVAAAKSGG